MSSGVYYNHHAPTFIRFDENGGDPDYLLDLILEGYWLFIST
jgi:hypothetical protein